MTSTTDFGRMTFERFKKMANDDSLSRHEKIGFPDHYREGQAKRIFEDICNKLALKTTTPMRVLDIGCGCDELAEMICDYCEHQRHKLLLLDSQEMLDQLNCAESVHKIPGRFPDSTGLIKGFCDQFDAILVYSVMQHVALESNPFTFVDKALRLLAPGGRLLIGDLPNVSKRKRFFASNTGIKFHKKYMKTSDPPSVIVHSIEDEKIDDGFVFGILQRCRLAGFESYLLPQPETLQMANRREDILIVRN